MLMLTLMHTGFPNVGLNRIYDMGNECYHYANGRPNEEKHGNDIVVDNGVVLVVVAAKLLLGLSTS